MTPIALVGGAACKTSEDFATIAATLDRAAKAVGVNLIGGYSALVSKGITLGDGWFHDPALPHICVPRNGSAIKCGDYHYRTLHEHYTVFVLTYCRTPVSRLSCP